MSLWGRCAGTLHTRGDEASPGRQRDSEHLPLGSPPLPGPTGIFFSSGPRWKAARQLAVRTLHGLGVGRRPVADKVLQELRCLVGELDQYGGE